MRVAQPQIDAGEVAGGDGAPAQPPTRLQHLKNMLRIEEINRLRAGEAGVFEHQPPRPQHLSAAPAILRALPLEANAPSGSGPFRAFAVRQVRAMEDVD